MKRKEKTEKKTPAPDELSWSAAEHGYTEKNLVWHLAVTGIALVLLAVAIWQKNYFFGVFIVVANLAVINSAKRRPKIFKFRITNEGIAIGDKFFTFDGLESFSLRERPRALHELIVKRKKYANPYLHIPLDGNTAVGAKVILRTRLPEKEHRESFLDLFADWLGL